MKRYIWIIACLILTVSCNTNEIFERELYKKVIAFISSDNYNVFEDPQELTDGENLTFVAVSCGGTKAPEVDVEVTVIPDETPFDVYNQGMYGDDTKMYANILPKSKYDIENYKIIIPKGERTGKLDIRIRPNGLSPDSTYFIPLSIKSLSAYEVNPDKSSILYQVLIKNFYAEQKTSGYTYYTMQGTRNGAIAQATKPIQPISKDKVRMMAGTVSFIEDLEKIEKYSVILEVQPDSSVVVTSYKNLEVVQDEDPDYPNIFRVETDDWGRKYKVFKVAYTYKDGDKTIHMREELRLQFTKE